MKALHILAGIPPGGGMAESVPTLCRHLRQLGQEVTLATLDGPASEAARAAEAAGVRVVRFAPSFPRALYFSWQMLRGLSAYVRAADVVHVHGAWTFPVWWGCRCALRAHKPLVMSPRGCLDPVRLRHAAWKKRLVGWIDRALLRRADAVHVTCEAEREWVAAYCDHPVVAMASVKNARGGQGTHEGDEVRKREAECPGKQKFYPHLCDPLGGRKKGGVVIPNGIDSTNERMTSRTNDELPRTAQRTRTVFYLGRLHPLKGLDLLVEAWGILRPLSGRNDECKSGNQADDIRREAVTNERSPWRLIIAGPDEQGTLAGLKEQAARLGLKVAEACSGETPSSDIVFAGPVYGEAKERLLAEADLVVLPSRSENFGIVVGEALACEVPVVMTDVGPWKEEGAKQPVQNAPCAAPWSPNGAIRFVETSAEGLADGLLDMLRLSDEELRERGVRGREWVSERFAWGAVASRMLGLYDGLLRPPSGRNGECKKREGRARTRARHEMEKCAGHAPVAGLLRPPSGRNGECKNGRQAGGDAHKA